MFDFTCGRDCRFVVENNPRRKLWGYFDDAGIDSVTLYDKIAKTIQEVAEQVRTTVGMDRSMWAVSATSLVYTTDWAKRGPPTVSTLAPGYHAFVNPGCCLESLLLNDTHNSDEVPVEEALTFIGYETDYMEPNEFLSRRPDVESWLYKVRTTHSQQFLTTAD